MENKIFNPCVQDRLRFRAWIPSKKTMTDPFDLESGWIKESFVFLMQSTGLIDSAGVDIWEGDILEDNFFNLEMRWWPEAARFAAFKNGYQYELFFDIAHPGQLIYNKVIGNIYENPELLQAKEQGDKAKTL